MGAALSHNQVFNGTATSPTGLPGAPEHLELSAISAAMGPDGMKITDTISQGRASVFQSHSQDLTD
jgi:hypothetical protein